MKATRVVRGVAIGVSATVAFLGLSDARAQEAPAAALGGYQGSAASAGLNAYYLPQGALPIETLLDLSAPDALATISSGPTTFARASAADPGDLLASPETLLTNASKDYPAGTIPNYPYRVSATSGFGAPTAESEPAPGLRAAVEVGQGSSAARATMPRAAAPAVATFGSMSAFASTTTDGSTVTVRVKTSMSDFNLLGMIVIDSVVTDLTATSDGTTTDFTGGTTISGAELLGTPITIDEKGIHSEPEDAPEGGNGLGDALGGLGGPLAELLTGADGLNEILKQAGIRITVARPVEQAAGTEGQLASTGLRVDFELSNDTAPILANLTDALPPIEPVIPGVPSPEDLIAFARARHLTRLEVARGVVSLAATTGATFPLSPPVAPVDTGSSGFAPTDDVPLAAPSALPETQVTPGSSPSLSTSPTATLPEVPVGAGIGALAALVLLAQPFLGTRLARFSTAVLAAGDTASCPLEERP
jgi:hypothetical protein